MKLTINTKEFKKSLKEINKVISQKDYQNLSLEAKQGQLILSAVDNHPSTSKITILFTSKIEANIEIEGQRLINAKILETTLSNIDNSITEIKLENDFLIIKDNNTNYKLFAFQDSFSDIIDNFGIKPEFIKICDIENLKEAIDKTYLAITEKESRFYLQGLCLDINKEKQRAVATNGHFILNKQLIISNLQDIKFFKVIPEKTVIFLKNILQNNNKVELNNNKVELFWDKNLKIKIIFNKNEIIANLIDGEFPDYESLYKNREDFNIKVSFNKRELEKSVKKILTYKANGANFDFDFVNKKLKIHYKQQSGSEILVETFLDLESDFQGETLKTSFSLSYLLDVISCQDEVILIKLKDDTSPVIIGNNDYNSIIMPRRI